MPVLLAEDFLQEVGYLLGAGGLIGGRLWSRIDRLQSAQVCRRKAEGACSGESKNPKLHRSNVRNGVQDLSIIAHFAS